ncbi:hypothetical protein TrRE_jg11135 [Triparma retinervis]|uniref:Uncharacterized protein n=1 Tax=Triparma retinervis TaxID=2557542 RepID=A0A9W6ZBY7_9STRA|nr:hypothetical protein TrRE_jg11135 [Triparma retinervis]
MKFAAVFALLIAGTAAFAPTGQTKAFSRGLALNGEDAKKGAGGMADTRDPEEKQDDDPRKSISAAPSFEEYMKQRDAN